MNYMASVSYDLDVASGALQWGETLQSVFDYGPQEAVNSVEWWAAHVHPDDAMVLNQAMDKMWMPWATNWQTEYRFRKGDNTYVTVYDSAAVVRGSDGKPVRLTGTLTPAQ